jgi:tetratricopeptide (TPR) repeat protein
LRDTLKKLPPSVGGVYLPRRNHFLGKSGAYEIDVRLNLRVFRRHPDILWQGKIHERIVEQVEAAGFETYCAPTLLEHDLLQLDRTTIAQKQQAYLQRILSELDRDPHSAWMAMQAGKTYQFLDDYANAQRYFEAAIQCDDPYARHLAICYLALLSAPGRDPEAGLRLLKTHASEAVQSGLHCFVQGELELLAGRPEAALAAYEKVSIVGDSSVVKRFPADKRFTPAQRAERFGTCYVALGEREKALEYFAQALSEEGVASRSHYALARRYLREGNREKSRVHLESALAISPEWTEVRHVLRALQD